MLTVACHQGEPPVLPEVEEKGDVYFSGYYWNYKTSSTLVGPGPNRFSSSPDNIFIDANGMLHLRITKGNNVWLCSELISVKEFGYGTYEFTTFGTLDNLNENVVLGLFTWDDYSFQNEANSEVDIEFSKWGNASDSLLLTYSVQPVWFDTPGPYAERSYKPKINKSIINGETRHLFTWTPDSVVWKSFTANDNVNPFAKWVFNKNNISRTKIEGNRVSNPIIIPKPSDSTNVRFNLWLLHSKAPSDGKEAEVIIKSFKYYPL